MFVTHFYNFYFAHTAGGRMIGKVFLILSLASPGYALFPGQRALRRLLRAPEPPPARAWHPAVLLQAVLVILWVGNAAHRVEQQRDFSAPPATGNH